MDQVAPRLINETALINRLTSAGLRPTRQRLMLGMLLFTPQHRHVTAESLHTETKRAGIHVSLATIYNTLHQFTASKLLREVSLQNGKSYFDTNVSHHHHFIEEETGELMDIPSEHVVLSQLPAPPHGTEVASVDVIVRLRKSAN